MRVGFFYYFDENWAGGSYYFLSLLRMSKYIPNKKNVQLFILYDKNQNLQNLKKECSGVYQINFVRNYTSDNLFGKIYSKVIFKYYLNDVKFYLFSLKTVYLNIPKSNRYFWLGDLQNRVTPEYFDKVNLSKRLKYQDRVLLGGENVVVTSHTMFSEVQQFYDDKRIKRNGRIFIAPFVSFLDTEKNTNISSESTFNLKKAYFYVPNQFWAHKNHLVVIEALRILNSKDVLDFDLIFTGKEYDFRNPEYTNGLKHKINEYGLSNNVIFLGFVDRCEQIRIFQNAIAIIQPSFYEGWGTVVEDSKALKKKVIASDIPVHLEQLKEKAVFFDPYNPKELANKIYDEFLLYVQNGRRVFNIDYNYNLERAKYSQNFYQIFES
jgi:glycosyltransferase involved in cell wall biosynthesis